MKVDKDLPSEIHVVKSSSSSHKKEKLDEIISHAKLLYKDILELNGMKNLDHLPFVGRLARIIEKLEKFKEREL